MAKSNRLLAKARAHVEALFKEKKPQWIRYHNFEHSKKVAKACREIGTACHLSAGDLEVVILAAWFHDTGYIESFEAHEEKSAEIADAFLRENGYSQEKIAQVAGCIRATKMPQKPHTLREKVLCDADIAHLASKDCFEASQLIRLEIEHQMGRRFSEIEWLTMNTDFVAGHRYHTDYARVSFAERHEKNVAALRKRLNQAKLRQGNSRGTG